MAEPTKLSHWLADVVNATGYYPVPVSTTVERMPMPGDSLDAVETAMALPTKAPGCRGAALYPAALTPITCR